MPSVAPADAATPLVLAIDLGTSSARVLAFDAQGRALADSEVQHRYAIRTSVAGAAETDAPPLFDLLVETIDDAVARLGALAGEIVAVGFTSFWHGLLGLRSDGAANTPVFYWADTRSAPDAAALRRELDESVVLDRTGCRFHSSYWPAKLRWLARTRPAQTAEVARWTGFAEYALGRLCGFDGLGMSFSMASGTGLLDVHRLVWDAELLGSLGLDLGCLLPLVDLGPSLVLSPEWAGRWPALAAKPWFPALGDGACANVGSGAVGPDRIALTLGTSGAVRLVLPAPPERVWHANPRLWAYRLDCERAVLGGAVSNGGNVLAWFRSLLGAEPDGSAMAAAAALEADVHGLTILPFVAGERSPAWHDDASGVVAGLTLATRPEHILRAALEAVAYRLAVIYRDLAPLATPDHTVVANGGAILQSPLWLQIVADALGHPLIALPPDDEASARGIAVMALFAAGVIAQLEAIPDPAAEGLVYDVDPARHARYHAAMERQARLEARLFEREAAWDASNSAATWER